MNSQKLRVLQVEDSESDAALIVRLLAKSGYEVDAFRVEDGDEMRAALARLTWDVVLADNQLPDFGGKAALEVMRESGDDIPFLIVSGNISVADAVDLMKAGAHDYVMKGDLARLVPAVARELREAQARRARREAEDRLALAVSATQLGTFDYYPQTGELILSDGMRKHFGLGPNAPASYKVFLDGLHPDDRERVNEVVQRCLAPGSVGQFLADYRTVGIEDGVERWISAQGRAFFDSQGRPVRFIGVTLDVTERKRLEEQFRQSQKLESIGQLAGAIAHDFNNLLTVIAGLAQTMADELKVDDPLWEAASEICGVAERGTSLTRQLLAFSRKQVSEPKDIVLNDVIRRFERILRRLVGDNIQLLLELDPSAGVVRADPGQIEQVILNLVVNARDAMPDGGQLVLRSGREVLEHDAVDGRLSAASGTYAVLTVSDTGVGMPPEVQAHVFEPFFTTKEPGKGTGLGLSTVYGIVKQSGGAIGISSVPGKGTTFRILLPAVERVPAEEPRTAAAAVGTATGTILLAEDEPGVRDFIRRSLARRGYTVLAAPSGVEALGLARRHARRFDLLLADVSMPEMGGVELAGRFAIDYPGVPVVLMSGDATALASGNSKARYLEKPFSSAALLSCIVGALNPGEGAP